MALNVFKMELTESLIVYVYYAVIIGFIFPVMPEFGFPLPLFLFTYTHTHTHTNYLPFLTTFQGNNKIDSKFKCFGKLLT